MNTNDTSAEPREPWNKGKLTGQKAPLRLRDIWAIRIRLQLAGSFETLPCSISRSTASSGHVIW